jgi:Fic family protein
MADTPFYAQLRHALTEDPDMARLLKRVTAAHLSWEEFQAMPLSGELGHDAVWELMRLLSRAMGIEIPVPDLDGNDYWYHRTHEIADSIAQIQCLCRADSSLYRRLTATRNTSILVRSRIDETIAAARLDGLAVSVEHYEEMLRTERPPRTDNEQLVYNTLRALDRLEHLRNEPFSLELLMHLRSLVIEGVDIDGLVHTERRLGTVSFDYESGRTAKYAARQTKYICDYANHLSGDMHDHAVFRALLLPDLFRFYQPLPDVNSQVGRLAFRLYTIKTGLPVLGLLPLSQTRLDWEDGKLGSTLVSQGPVEHAEGRNRNGVDLTDYATLSVQLALVALLDLNWKLHKLEREDAELRDLLQRDPEINHRQRSILGRALKNPQAEFRIAYHKTTHNVVYATARADLLELVEKGYLVTGKKGRAMIFTPREGLREFIESGYRHSGPAVRP